VRATNVIDISVLLGAESAVYPGDPGFTVTEVSTYEDGYALSKLSMSAHSGTHLDAPAHFIEGGKNIAGIGPARFVVPALVIDAGEAKEVGQTELEQADIRPGDAVLLKTMNSKSGLSISGSYSPDFVALNNEGASYLIEQGASLVGIDYISIENSDSEGSPVHKALLSADVLVLEMINLKGVDAGRYLLVCPPLKIEAEGAPCRALLVVTDM